MGFLKARAERQMADQVFNLKFTSKQLNKASKKAEKDERVRVLLMQGHPWTLCCLSSTSA